MPKLTTLQYGVIMQAIYNAKCAIADDEFIDPYNNEEGLTNDDVLKVLNEAEAIIVSEFLTK